MWVALLKPNTLRLTAAVIMDIGVLALAIILNYKILVALRSLRSMM